MHAFAPTLRRSSALILALTAALPAQMMQGEPLERVVETYSVQHLRGTHPFVVPPIIGDALGRWQAPEFLQLLSQNDSREPIWNLSEFVDAIQNALDEDISNSDGEIALYRSGLLLNGPPELVDRLKAVVRSVDEQLSRPIEIRARLMRLQPGAGLPGTILDSGAAVPQNELLWEARTVTQSGRQTKLAQEHFTPFLRDISVEVAQRSGISDLNMSNLFEGIAVQVEPYALSGADELALFCQYGFAEQRGPMRTVATGHSDLGFVEVPELDVAGGSFAGRLSSGQSLCVSMQGLAGVDLALVVDARFLAPKPTASQEVALIPTGALVTGAMSAGVWSGSPEDVNDATLQNHVLPLGVNPATGQSSERMSLDEVRELSNLAIRDLVDEGIASVDWISGYLVVTGPPEAQRRVARFVASQENRLLQNLSLEFRSAAGREDLHRMRAPGLHGLWVVAMRGTQSTNIVDFDVEIAQRYAIPDPIIVDVFGGLVAQALPNARAQGEILLESSVVHSVLSEPQRHPTESAEGVNLFFGQADVVRRNFKGPVPDGSAETLGNGSRLGGATTRLEVTVSR